MRQLTVSIKTSEEVMNDFQRALQMAKKGKIKTPHFEVSFDNRKDFERFVKNIHLLSTILAFKPKSIYELAKIAHMDVSNLNKIIVFLESVDVLKIKTSRVAGRLVRTPIVNYQEINFRLAA